MNLTLTITNSEEAIEIKYTGSLNQISLIASLRKKLAVHYRVISLTFKKVISSVYMGWKDKALYNVVSGTPLLNINSSIGLKIP